MTAPEVVALTRDHWPGVVEVWAAGIATGHATFEVDVPRWERFDAGKLSDQRHAAVDAAGRVVGFAAAGGVSDRCAYAGVVEHSVYVHPAVQGRGVGRLLLDALVASTEAAGLWTIQSGIFPDNAASLALHRAAGFREVGIRSRVGRMAYGPRAGQWRDVVMVERRSTAVGLT